MPSIRPQDRVSLCHFSFADGRRCLTPISPGHPHFCFYHAQKEAQSVAAEKLGRDLDYFFSGDYLSACDLSAAVARLFAAVARGHIKPRAARTLAYLAQTLVQTIHLSQHEYINAFGTDAWRQAVRDSVHQNATHDSAPPGADSPHPAPAPHPPAPAAHQPTRSAPSAPPGAEAPAPAPAAPPTQCSARPSGRSATPSQPDPTNPPPAPPAHVTQSAHETTANEAPPPPAPGVLTTA
jgi:hypothetical protein